MATGTPYIPNTDVGAKDWGNNFSTLITATPGAYGLVAADASAIAVAYTNYAAALLLVVNPATKTVATVAAKNAAKAAALSVWRFYAQNINANVGVSNLLKAGLGLTIRTGSRTPIPAPATNPTLLFIGNTPLQSTYQFRDSSDPVKRGKPNGVKLLELFAVTSNTVISDPTVIPFKKIVTKQPFAIDWASGDVGQTAYIAARWTNPVGQPGPFSPIYTVTVS